ncbi:Nif3-like dinuclear metal center hexameric protein [Peptoniphilus equinus]|uniref:GTP cyclohydrolase 1 type 2 homolog n=1 Tax=Peptoniphilus equinus TaxID=3016343 RepID=A0ABY7QUC3_9FIRM|nr:Nif3-like dinuclear metal center hexameric protein [Peptoniphilus equinus]WBW50389.1 Nif3-like dinuclear metal center hexameric protein [Peptoniphilus equinus]
MDTAKFIDYIETLAPLDGQEAWDNSGWQVMTKRDIKRVFLTLDLTDTTLAEAKAFGADLILTHHPFFFSGVTSIGYDYKSKLIRELLASGIGLYASHTALDVAAGGVNDVLASYLELTDLEPLMMTDKDKPLGVVGTTDWSLLKLYHTLTTLSEDTVQLYGKLRDIHRVALLGGAGGGDIKAAFDAGADVYITSDVKHHDAQVAYELGFILIALSHNDSEKLILTELARRFEDDLGLNTKINAENAFVLRLPKRP